MMMLTRFIIKEQATWERVALEGTNICEEAKSVSLHMENISSGAALPL
jgi:hypothetical protein